MKEWTSSMSMDETRDILSQAQELRRAGKKKEAMEMAKRIPIDPEYAEDLKRLEGLKFLIDGGFNLTDAVAKRRICYRCFGVWQV